MSGGTKLTLNLPGMADWELNPGADDHLDNMAEKAEKAGRAHRHRLHLHRHKHQQQSKV